MRRLRFTIETFTKVSTPSEPWEDSEWSPDGDENKYEPRHVQGVIDIDDIQYYFAVRDDRVAVIFKNGAVVSVIDEFETFYHRVEKL